jgi:hypothetical protein
VGAESAHQSPPANDASNLGWASFSKKMAWRTLQGYEAMHMVRKGQMYGVEKGNITEQMVFIMW